MKTLVKDNISLYVFEDTEVVNVGADKTIIGDPAQLIVSDCNSTDTVLHENVTTPPEDWVGWKYLYIDGVWSLNPKWRDIPSSTL